MSLVEAFNASVDIAVKDGNLDTVKHGAIIEAARIVAAKVDAMEKNDNVSAGVFLKYCDALGIMPDNVKQEPTKPKAKLTAFTSSAKFAKVDNG